MAILFRLVLTTALFLSALYSENGVFFDVSMASPDRGGKWIENGELTPAAYELLTAIRTDTTILCDKKRYGLARIDRYAERIGFDPDARTGLETVLSDIEALYLHDRKDGCLDPYAIFPDQIGIDKRENNETFRHANVLLRKLEKALHFYETIDKNGGWNIVKADFRLLKEGQSHRAVPAIKARLRVTGDYNLTADLNETYGPDLAEAVRIFQARHGLKADGIVGPRTVEALNIPVTEKIEKIRLNIERLRWLTDGNGDFVAANIPDYSLTLYRQERPVLTMKTVVGRRDRPTPMLSDTLTYAVLNPYWRAPKTIVEEDILPKLRAGAFDYLDRVGIVAVEAADGNVTVDLRSVDWRRYESENIPYIFLQKPGLHNYLGFVKFMFPNDFDVYIHDTSHDELFEESDRARSSGCIRVEKPLELFHALFNPHGDNGWRYKKIVRELMKREEKLVGLPDPLPVYILYMTAYVDENDRVRFLPDIYGYDRQMEECLKSLNEY